MKLPQQLVAVLLCLPGLLRAEEPVDYVRDIKPLLKARCYACHGALKQQANLRLDAQALMQKGGDAGPVIEPGKSSESLLIDAVTGANGITRMPPQGEAEPLGDAQIALLKRWIDQGAPAPADEQPEEDPRRHWAFQVPVRPALPAVNNSAWIGNPIDRFLAAQQERRGIQPNPPAEKHVLLRRVSLDLIGLPPTRDELHAFLADSSPEAYEKVVERLLASPQYGERWGRHWMDVWRYSDWYGRRSQNDLRNSYSLVWRWRDWIINSLNQDKPYDRMVTEMLAADEVAPADDQAVMATGYVVRNFYSLNYNQWMRDLVEHTGKAFLGLTFNCAHCHDHKYDPITQEEYFRFRAFFEPLELRRDRVAGEPDPGPFLSYVYGSSTVPVKTGMIRVYDVKPNAETFMYRMGDERDRFDRPPVGPAAPAFLGGDKLKLEPVELPPVAHYPGLKPALRQEDIAHREAAVKTAEATLETARRALTAATAEQSGPARTAVQIAESQLAAAQSQRESLHARIAADDVRFNGVAGDPAAFAAVASKAERAAALRTAEVAQLVAEKTVADAQAMPDGDAKLPAVKTAEEQLAAARQVVEKAQTALTAESSEYSPLSPVYPMQSSGRRRALAGWIASRDNPLTARVAVNHIWMRHFGRPLVASVFDFGRNGKRPTHPELLDWLAVEFMEAGWSMKHLHRLLVTSQAYRMDSRIAAADHPNLALDRDNQWLWHFAPRRAEAEVIRDSLLYLAGELDLQMGGLELENSAEDTSWRRSLYFSIHVEEGGHPRFLELFDAPNPRECYRRSESILPQQALAMTNSRLSVNQSRLLAGKLSQLATTIAADAADGEAAFVTAAFEHILSRAPTKQEQDFCREFLQRQRELYTAADPQQLAPQTGEGLVPVAAEPAQRARESLVRALFSHNDFVTVR